VSASQLYNTEGWALQTSCQCTSGRHGKQPAAVCLVSSSFLSVFDVAFRYLYRALQSLLSADGVHVGSIIVMIDGYYNEPADLCKLLGVKGLPL
jgi:hypothetical protein